MPPRRLPPGGVIRNDNHDYHLHSLLELGGEPCRALRDVGYEFDRDAILLAPPEAGPQFSAR